MSLELSNKKKVIIVRYGEIGTKSRQTRRRIEAKLIENIRQAVGPLRISREYGRIFVDSDSKENAEKISRVFGVVSTSLATKISSQMDEILREGTEYAKDNLSPSMTFAVRARRTGEHPYTSKDIEKKLGARIIEATGAAVNLSNPDFTIYVEVRNEYAYVFDEIIRGVGGLPLGTQGKAVSLVSGGIDSPVATWMIMKRGVDPVCLYLDSSEIFGEGAKRRALNTIKKLAEWKNDAIKTYIVPYNEVLGKIRESGKLTCVLCKRSMLKIGEKIAEMEGAKALVTGENLGQVASQTMDNIYAIDRAATIPVFRPLLALDKNEIIEIAKNIGTYLPSIETVTCCWGPPKYPETRANLERVIEAEKEIGIDKLILEAVAKNRIVEVK
jgi:thiamine biosynthesis protein ThiI